MIVGGDCPQETEFDLVREDHLQAIKDDEAGFPKPLAQKHLEGPCHVRGCRFGPLGFVHGEVPEFFIRYGIKNATVDRYGFRKAPSFGILRLLELFCERFEGRVGPEHTIKVSPPRDE
jgi:hypothetical protein